MKTTKKHFEIFKKECLYWIKRLGLTDWEVRFKHGDHKGAGGEALSTCGTQQGDRICELRLYITWGVDDDWNPVLSTAAIKKYALHEVLHQLLAPLAWHAKARFTAKCEIDEAEHAMIQRLINAFLEDSG